MAIPAAIYVQIASQGLPVVAALAVWGRQPPAPYLRLAAWCAFLLWIDTAAIGIAAVMGNNWWLSYYAMPLEVAFLYWILAFWQPSGFLRRVYLGGGAAMLLFAAVIYAAWPPAVSFPSLVAPVVTTAALAASLHTLVHRSVLSRNQLYVEDWFWVSLGLSIMWASTILIPSFLALFVRDSRELSVVVMMVRAAFVTLAFAIVGWGVACPRVLRSPGRL